MVIMKYCYRRFFLQRGLCHTIIVNGTVDKLGEVYGLSLMLDAEPHEYYGPHSATGTGLKLMLHDHNVLPVVERESIDIPPGFKTTLRIRKKKVDITMNLSIYLLLTD